ncbi:NADPH-dependent FMN reductase [Stenotrophomonas mori]|uniref:NAD(P)H-dependent oxidoreductase n=1 Tax=Stenotrophomonas mori TaxID=2871096 RepID=A0ABT0SF32_9GAMM|nr:NADPH-dependent FMN reductase [Stenotrophomonas mori]MCL7713911.1 NAD(P)H-dependent oxidoreductase [Stenotrophomonas mori]
MEPFRIAVLVGSLRRESHNRRLALALEKLAGERARFDYLRIDDIPLYNQDRDSDFPEQGTRLKDGIRGADAVLFVTAEYNRSIPGVLKNAIDTASRPYGDGAFDGKPAALIGTSPGAAGTAMAQQHLRNVLVFVNLSVMAQPEAFLRHREGAIDAEGGISDEGTRRFLQGYVDRFLAWIAAHPRPH